MPRVKRGVTAHRKHKKVLGLTKGQRGSRSKLIRRAQESMMRSLAYAYRDRKARKGEFRRLWITRINAAARLVGISYSKLIEGLAAADVQVNRKVLADLAVNDFPAFARLAEMAKEKVGQKQAV